MADPLAVYGRLWALSNLALHVTFHGGSLAGLLQSGWAQRAFTVLAAASAVAPSNGRLLVAAHAASIWQFSQMLPAVFDADCWAVHHDAAFLLSAAAVAVGSPRLLLQAWTGEERAAVFAGLSQCLRVQAALWYGGAFFWKLNRAFFEPSNCPALFFLQLVDYWLPVPLPDSALSFIARSAPHVTEAVEGGLAAMIWLPGFERAAVVLGGLREAPHRDHRHLCDLPSV